MHFRVLTSKTISRLSGHLPVPSAALQKIAEVLRDPDASATDLALVLKEDPSVAGKVLRLANSAYIGFPRAVSSVQHAVVLLGFKRIQSLIITTELLSSCRNTASFPFSIDRFRLHSVTVACIAENIGRHLRRYRDIDENELFSGALLHDIGKLIAAIVDPSEVKTVSGRSIEQCIPYYRAETDTFSHTIFGSAVGEAWNFPAELIACIRGHHAAACFPDYHRIVSIVHIADVMAHLIGYPLFPEEVTPAIDEAALREVDLPVERLRVIADEILNKQELIGSLLEVVC